MRVTHVITRLILGGAQENTVATVLGLHNKPPFQVSLLSGPTQGREGTLEHYFHDNPQLLQVVPNLVREINPWKDFWAYRDLLLRFRKDAPNIVHTHSGKAGILGRLAAAKAAVPLIIHTIHGPSFGPFQGAIPNAIYRQAEVTAAKKTTHFISVAQAMTDQYLAAGIGTSRQYSLIYSGFPLGPYLQTTNDPGLRKQLGLEPEDFVIGKVARLFELKGHDDLLHAAQEIVQKFPRARFLFVGDGPWRNRFERMVREQGLTGKVIFTGLVPPEQIPSLLGVMDMLVHLSRREGLPRALSQALAAGKPVLAYDCDGAREVCLDNITGVLLKPGDVSGVAAGILKIARNPALANQFGTAGRNLVREKFSVEGMVQSIGDLYLRLAREQNLLP
ncbi:MAG: glycosyltransferase family 4 protein [Verrucomicrobiota bacterium]|nr:glycosyltransferase family 4 protein [Verrucomicrobiota bacterium]